MPPKKEGLTLVQIKSVKDLKRLAKMAHDTKTTFDSQMGKMTLRQAKEIRKIRVDKGYSWRMVARTCHDRGYWKTLGKWEPTSNQLMGMALCERAAKFFNEEYMDKTWN
jgi:hypothetical protein